MLIPAKRKKLSKLMLLSRALFLVTVAMLFIDLELFVENPLKSFGLGVHWIPEFFLFIVGSYQVTKYGTKAMLCLTIGFSLFWVFMALVGFNLRWSVNSFLLFLDFLIIGALIALCEKKTKWKVMKNGIK